MPKKERHRKDPARVAAGRKAWARMSASAKAKVVARLRPFRKKGRGSPGGTHRTTSAKRSVGRPASSSGGGSTAGAKPRVAIYGGAIASAGAIAGFEGLRPPGFYDLAGNRSRIVQYGAANIAKATTTVEGASKAFLPLLLGTIASVGADKLGLNKALAKARMPFRI